MLQGVNMYEDVLFSVTFFFFFFFFCDQSND